MTTVFARVVRKRKDGAEMTFKDYKGNTVTKNYQPVMTIFRQDNGRLSAKFEVTEAPNPEAYWYNVYEQDGKQPRKGAGSRRKQTADTDLDEDFG